MGDISSVIKDSLSNSSIFRSLFYSRLRKLKVQGSVLDLGSGEKARYLRFNNLKNLEITTIGLEEDRFKPSITHNLEEKLPIGKEHFDNIFAFNILEHIYNHKQLIVECYRVLKKDGHIFIVVPFLVRIHADPNDFFRYSKSSLHNLLKEARFQIVSIEPLGFGPFTAGYFQVQPIIPRIMSFLLSPLLFVFIYLDKLVDRLARKSSKKENYPLGYFVIARK